MIATLTRSPIIHAAAPRIGRVTAREITISVTTLIPSQPAPYTVTCSTGTTPFTYSWLRGSTALPATSTVNDTPFTTQNSATTASASYTVTVSNAAGAAAVTRNISNSAYTGTPPPGSETLTFLHPNLTGSTIMATNASGAVLWREDYLAYGERIRKEAGSTIAAGTNPASAASSTNRTWFTGKLHDETTGLSYFGARYYDPQVGRFMGFDPHGFEERSPLSFNRYAYANNNPVKFVDPDGRQAVQALGLAGRAMGPAATIGDQVRGGSPAPACGPTCGVLSFPGDAPKSPQIMSNPIQVMGSLIMATPITIVQALHIVTSAIFPDFDSARLDAFTRAGMTDSGKVDFSKVDQKTGTVVEFKSPGGAKVGYDGPHKSPGLHHDKQHISWQTGGKRSADGRARGNNAYEGEQHPSRSDDKAE